MNNTASSDVSTCSNYPTKGAGPRRTLTNERNRDVNLLPVKPAENVEIKNRLERKIAPSITQKRLNAIKYSENVANTQKKVVDFKLDNSIIKKYKNEDKSEKYTWWSSKGREEDKAMQIRIGLLEKNDDDDNSNQSIQSAAFSVHPEYTAQARWHLRPTDTNIHWSYFNVVKSILLRENLLLKMHVLLIDMDKAYWVYGCYRIKYASIIEENKELLESTYAAQQAEVNNGGAPIPVSMASIAVTKEINAMKEKCFRSREQLIELQNEFTVAMAHLRAGSLSVVENILCWRGIAQKEKPTNELLSLMWNGDNYLVKMLTDALFITSNHVYKPPHKHHMIPTPIPKVKLKHLQHLHATSEQYDPLAIAKNSASARVTPSSMPNSTKSTVSKFNFSQFPDVPHDAPAGDLKEAKELPVMTDSLTVSKTASSPINDDLLDLENTMEDVYKPNNSVNSKCEICVIPGVFDGNDGSVDSGTSRILRMNSTGARSGTITPSTLPGNIGLAELVKETVFKSMTEEDMTRGLANHGSRSGLNSPHVVIEEMLINNSGNIARNPMGATVTAAENGTELKAAEGELVETHENPAQPVSMVSNDNVRDEFDELEVKTSLQCEGSDVDDSNIQNDMATLGPMTPPPVHHVAAVDALVPNIKVQDEHFDTSADILFASKSKLDVTDEQGSFPVDEFVQGVVVHTPVGTLDTMEGEFFVDKDQNIFPVSMMHPCANEGSSDEDAFGMPGDKAFATQSNDARIITPTDDSLNDGLQTFYENIYATMGKSSIASDVETGLTQGDVISATSTVKPLQMINHGLIKWWIGGDVTNTFLLKSSSIQANVLSTSNSEASPMTDAVMLSEKLMGTVNASKSPESKTRSNSKNEKSVFERDVKKIVSIREQLYHLWLEKYHTYCKHIEQTRMRRLRAESFLSCSDLGSEMSGGSDAEVVEKGDVLAADEAVVSKESGLGGSLNVPAGKEDALIESEVASEEVTAADMQVNVEESGGNNVNVPPGADLNSPTMSISPTENTSAIPLETPFAKLVEQDEKFSKQNSISASNGLLDMVQSVLNETTEPASSDVNGDAVFEEDGTEAEVVGVEGATAEVSHDLSDMLAYFGDASANNLGMKPISVEAPFSTDSTTPIVVQTHIEASEMYAKRLESGLPGQYDTEVENEVSTPFELESDEKSSGDKIDLGTEAESGSDAKAEVVNINAEITERLFGASKKPSEMIATSSDDSVASDGLGEFKISPMNSKTEGDLEEEIRNANANGTRAMENDSQEVLTSGTPHPHGLPPLGKEVNGVDYRVSNDDWKALREYCYPAWNGQGVGSIDLDWLVQNAGVTEEINEFVEENGIPLDDEIAAEQDARDFIIQSHTEEQVPSSDPKNNEVSPSRLNIQNSIEFTNTTVNPVDLADFQAFWDDVNNTFRNVDSVANTAGDFDATGAMPSIESMGPAVGVVNKQRSSIYSDGTALIDHIKKSPAVMEVAAGLSDVYPSKYILPPIPAALQKKCEWALQICLREREIMNKKRELKRSCRKLKEDTIKYTDYGLLNKISGGNLSICDRFQSSDWFGESREAEAGFGGEEEPDPSEVVVDENVKMWISASLQDLQVLRHRQQTDGIHVPGTKLPQPLSTSSSLLSAAGGSRKKMGTSLINMLKAANTNPKRTKANTETSDVDRNVVIASPSLVTPGSASSRYSSQNRRQLQQIQDASSVERDSLGISKWNPVDQTEQTANRNVSFFLTTDEGEENVQYFSSKQEFLPMVTVDSMGRSRTIENPAALNVSDELVKNKIEEKVKASRAILERDPVSGILKIKDEEQGRRAGSGLKNTRYWRVKLCILIQAVIRMFIAKRRVARKRWALKQYKIVTMIQRRIRGILARIRFKEKRRLIRVDALRLRRIALHKHNSAVKIARFMRYAAYVNKLTIRRRGGKKVLLSVHQQQLRDGVRLAYMDATRIQKRWRGVLGRKIVAAIWRRRIRAAKIMQRWVRRIQKAARNGGKGKGGIARLFKTLLSSGAGNAAKARVKTRTVVGTVPEIPEGGVPLNAILPKTLPDKPIGIPGPEEVVVEVLPEKIHHHQHHYLASKHSAGHGIHHHKHIDHSGADVVENPHNLLVADKTINAKTRKKLLLKKIIQAMSGRVCSETNQNNNTHDEEEKLNSSRRRKSPSSARSSSYVESGDDEMGNQSVRSSLGSRTLSEKSYDSAYDDVVYRAPVRESLRHCKLLQYDPINPLLRSSKGFGMNPDSPPPTADTMVPHESQLPKNLFSYKKNKRTFLHCTEVLESKHELSQSMKNMQSSNRMNADNNELNSMSMSALPALSQSWRNNEIDLVQHSNAARETRSHSLVLPDIKASQTQLLLNLMNKSTNMTESSASLEEASNIPTTMRSYQPYATSNNTVHAHSNSSSSKKDAKYKKLETLQTQQVDIYRKITQPKVCNPNDVYQTPALNDPYGKRFDLHKFTSSNTNSFYSSKNSKKQLTTFGLSQLMQDK